VVKVMNFWILEWRITSTAELTIFGRERTLSQEFLDSLFLLDKCTASFSAIKWLCVWSVCVFIQRLPNVGSVYQTDKNSICQKFLHKRNCAYPLHYNCFTSPSLSSHIKCHPLHYIICIQNTSYCIYYLASEEK
jgi:hypothetical protein